jgi:hypothetical protein
MKYMCISHPHPFIIIFSDRHARDVVFAAGRAIDGAVELRFSAWDIDKFGDRTNILYHVKLSIEGIPQYAWSHEIAAKVLGDEAFIHHVKEATRKRIDRHTYQCWAFSLDPSHIPQIVFLTMIDSEVEIVTDVHFIRPRKVKKGHVFKVLIYIDVVEDLLFYHFPQEELIADGKISWRDFIWQFGRPDGDLEEEKFLTLNRL